MGQGENVSWIKSSQAAIKNPFHQKISQALFLVLLEMILYVNL